MDIKEARRILTEKYPYATIRCVNENAHLMFTEGYQPNFIAYMRLPSGFSVNNCGYSGKTKKEAIINLAKYL
jgi:hypothetical protein